MSVQAFRFGPFYLDVARKQLRRDGEPVAMSARQIELLCALVVKAGQIVSKDTLIEAVWSDVAVTDNSLEQAISGLRRTLATAAEPQYIETHARRGYRFVAPVTRVAQRETDAALDALLAPHRAWIEGRAALETLERTGILHAREVFERVVAVAPTQPAAHVGLANACLMQFEMTRTDRVPDLAALEQAARHAREACRLDRDYGEAWATLGLVLDRTERRADALAALRRAVTLEADNWRHHVRLSYGSWGEERLRAAGRTLTLLPAFPMAHWLAATVHIARQAFADADRELSAGVASLAGAARESSRFNAVALHWLTGLLHLRRDEDDAALAAFARELATESSGQVYARECCANTWYAMGALHLKRGRLREAATAFEQAIARVSTHPMAHLGLAHVRHRLDGVPVGPLTVGAPGSSRVGVDAAMYEAAHLVLAGRAPEAAPVVERALDAAPSGNAGWLLPVEPLIQTEAAPEIWAAALSMIRTRAA